MNYSVVIPTRRAVEKILPTLFSLSIQTLQPEKIFLIIDQKLTNKEYDQYKQSLKHNLGDVFYRQLCLISNIDSDFIPDRGVSYARNFGYSLVDSPLLLSVDDDNTFDTDFCKRLVSTYKLYQNQTKNRATLIPTEMYKGQIRSRGYRAFRPILGIQRPVKINKRKMITIGQEKLYPIQFASSNCIFGSTEILQTTPFDERMEFVYEDFDMTRRLSKKYGNLFVLLDLKITHNMREKSTLEQTYLGSPQDAYQKSRNRIFLIKNSGSFREKLDYFLVGLRVHTIFLFYKIIFFAPKSAKISLLKSVLHGTRDGLFS